MPNPARPLACVAACAGALAAPAVADAAPRIDLVRCVQTAGCPTSPPSVRPGAKVRIGGVRLERGMRLRFLGVRGSRDDRDARVSYRSSRLAYAPVPRGARSGQVVLITRQGFWSPRFGPVTIRNSTVDGGSGGAVFGGDGMWIWQLERVLGGDLDRIASAARDHGIETVYLKSADGGSVWRQFSAANVAGLKARGLRVCGWHYVYGSSPLTEAAASAVAKERGADCFVIDAEAEYEGRYAQAQSYVQRLRELVGPSFPLGMSSFPYVQYHPAFPYSVFFAPGMATVNLPQMYWVAIGTSVDSVYSTTYRSNRPYGRAIHAIGQLWQSPSVASIQRFRQLARAYGSTGVSWWSWQHASSTGVAAAGDPFPALEGFTADRSYAALSQGSSGDVVVQAQQLLNGAGAALPVTGTFGAQTDAAVRSFQTSSRLPATGTIGDDTWARLVTVTPRTANWKAGAAGLKRGARNGPRSAFLPARGNELAGKPGRGG